MIKTNLNVYFDKDKQELIAKLKDNNKIEI